LRVRPAAAHFSSFDSTDRLSQTTSGIHEERIVSSPPVENAQLVAALKKIQLPGFERDLVSFGVVKAVEVQGGQVQVALQLGAPDPDRDAQIETAVRKQLQQVPGVDAVEVRFLAPGRSHGAGGTAPTQQIPGVAHMVAVASGKGGVGKSTVAVNLAVALALEGLAVGLLDSDIYGPSVPLMMGIEGQPQSTGSRILPLENHGVRTISTGYFVEEGAPVIWRGPMVMKALTQFLRDVEWGQLDYLVLDLPPGTGDAPLTLVQTVPLDGAVAVTTPQDVALIDAKKAVAMFRKTGVPVLGIVENMSQFVCPSCGHVEAIFGAGGGKAEAQRAGVPFLGEIPMETSIRECGDRGVPIVISAPESRGAQAFRRLAQSVQEAVGAAPVGTS
jgi:ATP-binding protein involved in chromosome partitioning